ncbi:MAG: hypothetical protein LBM39_01285 [Candidatus Methanoplasma sp.]|nr:hypothetical protein [Candidatus Methanoplasma sp.]
MNNVARIVATATQIPDVKLFRALVDNIYLPESSPFVPETFEQIATDANGLLSSAGTDADDREVLRSEPFGKNAFILTNARGTVIKFTNTEGRIVPDPYYSYQTEIRGPKTKVKVGKVHIQTTTAGAALIRMSDENQELSTAVTAFRKTGKSERHLHYAQIFTGILCMIFGTIAVQLFIFYVFGDAGVDFPSVFASIFFGLLLYALLGEIILHAAVRDYGTRQHFGEDGRQYDLYIVAYSADIVLHTIILLSTPHTWPNLAVIIASTIFFIFPSTYLVTTLWNLKREIVSIDRHETLINRRYYSNVPHKIAKEDYLPVTISLAIYTESNNVIFENLRGCIAASESYSDVSGQPVNIVVSDDGLMKLCGGSMDKDSVDTLLAHYGDSPDDMTPQERQAAERISFCRSNGIAFVARPLENRPGKFKKGGNLNFSYRLANGEVSGGYSEGEIHYHDIILTLDKDGVMAPGIIEAAIPEFVKDPRLAYAQGLTATANPEGNYFTRSMNLYFYMLQNTGLPSKSLMGHITPLMGHNAFLRRSFMEESSLWSEDRVSEDLAKAIDASIAGYHGKYIAYSGLEFTEYVCDTFIEETGKQLRYAYGLTEILVRGSKQIRGLKAYQKLDMFSYFCSYINIAALIPTYLVFLRYDIFHLVYGGFIANSLMFFVVPLILTARIQNDRHPLRIIRNLIGFIIVGITFFAHGYSLMKSFFIFATDRIRIRLGKNYVPFPPSGVGTQSGSSRDGWRLLYAYYRRNPWNIILSAVFLVNGIRMLTWLDGFVPAVIIAGAAQILFAIAVPVLTPQLLGGRRGKSKKTDV